MDLKNFELFQLSNLGWQVRYFFTCVNCKYSEGLEVPDLIWRNLSHCLAACEAEEGKVAELKDLRRNHFQRITASEIEFGKASA